MEEPGEKKNLVCSDELANSTNNLFRRINPNLSEQISIRPNK